MGERAKKTSLSVPNLWAGSESPSPRSFLAGREGRTPRRFQSRPQILTKRLNVSAGFPSSALVKRSKPHPNCVRWRSLMRCRPMI